MKTLDSAVEAIANADALFIGAGAGMGVDSGLPDFRGDAGFWNAYPPFKKLGLSFIDLANPRWFDRDPQLAWGFYGHRLHLYRDTTPHDGFSILATWGQRMKNGAFVFTSNVDGQFQRAGFDPQHVFECHGSIHHFQCTASCDVIWEGTDDVAIDEQFRAREPLPLCPRCGALARPNILMFGDGEWRSDRSDAQAQACGEWLSDAKGEVVVVECGAGTAIPSVRYQCEAVASRFDGTLIRINPRESHGPPGTLSFATGALDALRQINDRL